MPSDYIGFDYNEFAMECRPDGKIHFFPKDGEGDHYTIHPGNKSGILDIHKTYTKPDWTKNYETIFAIKHEDLSRLFSEIVPTILAEMKGVYRPLRLGWLLHRNIGIVVGLFPTEADLQKITKRKRKRLEFNNAAFLQNIRVPEYLEDIYYMPEIIFSLVSMRRRKAKWIGIAFKVTRPSEDVKLYWIKLKDIRHTTEQLKQLVVQAAMKYQMPKEEWPNIP